MAWLDAIISGEFGKFYDSEGEQKLALHMRPSQQIAAAAFNDEPPDPYLFVCGERDPEAVRMSFDLWPEQLRLVSRPGEEIFYRHRRYIEAVKFWHEIHEPVQLKGEESVRLMSALMDAHFYEHGHETAAMGEPA